MISLASAALAGCLAVSPGADHITIRDLAPAFSNFAAGPPDTPVALAPIPGFQRVFRLPELRRMALRLNVTAAPERELCFERPVAPLDPARLLEGMRKQLPEARITILASSRMPAPQGELEFPVSGLRQTPAGEFWAGSVRYGGSRRFAVWAKVQVVMRAPRVVAAEDLKPGRAVEASQLRVEVREEFPAAGIFARSLEEVYGRVLLHPVATGTALRSQWLQAARVIARGDTVQVDVWSGGAHLRMPAVAETSGSMGQTIHVRDAESKKRFPARVVGKGKVLVGKEGL